MIKKLMLISAFSFLSSNIFAQDIDTKDYQKLFLGQWKCVQQETGLSSQVSISENQIDDYGVMTIIDQSNEALESGFGKLSISSTDKYQFLKDNIYSFYFLSNKASIINVSNNYFGEYISNGFIRYYLEAGEKNIQNKRLSYRKHIILGKDTMATQPLDKTLKILDGSPRICTRQ